MESIISHLRGVQIKALRAGARSKKEIRIKKDLIMKARRRSSRLLKYIATMEKSTTRHNISTPALRRKYLSTLKRYAAQQERSANLLEQSVSAVKELKKEYKFVDDTVQIFIMDMTGSDARLMSLENESQTVESDLHDILELQQKGLDAHGEILMEEDGRGHDSEDEDYSPDSDDDFD